MRPLATLLAVLLTLAAPLASAVYQTLPTSPPLRITGFNNVTTDLISGLTVLCRQLLTAVEM